MAAGAGPALRDLHAEFGDRVGFVTLYTREAHPAERIDQPEELDTKLVNARAYQRRDRIPWVVAVDDLDGNLHRRLGPANTAYVTGTDGTVEARLLWATDVRGVRRALEAAVAGVRGSERRTRLVPVVRGAAEQKRILDLAGPRASRDVARVMPPVWVIGRVADLLPPWRPGVRGGLATVATTVLGAAAITAAWRTLRRMR